MEIILKVIDFIKSNPNWRDILANEPYHLIINDDNEFTILKYSQINSDFDNEAENINLIKLHRDKYNKLKLRIHAFVIEELRSVKKIKFGYLKKFANIFSVAFIFIFYASVA